MLGQIQEGSETQEESVVMEMESGKMSSKNFVRDLDAMLRKAGHHPDDGAIVFVMSIVPNESDIDGQHSMKTAVVVRSDIWPNECVVNRIIGYALPRALELIGIEPPPRVIDNISRFFSVN